MKGNKNGGSHQVIVWGIRGDSYEKVENITYFLVLRHELSVKLIW